MRCPVLAPSVAMLFSLAGCASSPFDKSYQSSASRDIGGLTESEQRVIGRADPQAAPRQEDVIEPVTLDDFVRLAETRNPRILAAEQRALAMRERVAQVTSLSDPMLEVTPIGEMAETAAGQVDLMAGVSQRLPFPGKLDARGRAADRSADVATEEIVQVRRAVIADTRRAYWNFYYSVRAIEVTERSSTLLQQVLDVAQARYRAGEISQDAVLRAAVERSAVDNELVRLRQRRDSAVAMLNMLIDRAPGAPVSNPPMARALGVDEGVETLLSDARDGAPAVLALRARLEQTRTMREIARLERLPDLTVSIAYNWVEDDGLSPVANGDDQWWVGFGVNLPIWQGRLRAAEREATRSMLETAGMLASEQNKAMYDVHDALARIDAQNRQIELLQRSILPDARQSVETALSGFRAGSVNFLTVVDNWKTLLNLELSLESSVVALETAVADLEQAIGRDVARQNVTEEVSHG